MLKAVIFDMDGTLLDSEVIHYIAIHEIILNRLGYDQPLEEYMRYCGTPDSEMWPDILRSLDRRAGGTGKAGFGDILAEEERVCEVSAELERLHWAGYEKYVETHGLEAFPGVPDLMAALKGEGLRIGIGTGSLRSVVESNLERMGVSSYVDAIATAEDCEKGKPAPDIFLRAAEYLQTDPADCLVVEDSANGMLAAGRAGMACVGFNGSQLPSDLVDPPIVFSDYRQVRPEDFFSWYEKCRNT